MIMRSNFVCAAIALTICMFAMTTKLLYSKLHFSLIAIAIGAVHLAAVLLNAVMIEVSMGKPGPSEALMGWLLFDLIDFPSTLLQLLISLPLRSFVLREVILPILFYGIFGSAQYMLLAELVVVCFGRKKVV